VRIAHVRPTTPLAFTTGKDHDPQVPYNWVRVPSSPPRARRNDVWDICFRHGGRLCENQIFYNDDGDVAHALIQMPDNPDSQLALLEELGAISFIGLVAADERENDLSPPPSSQPS
jgi:hypothetical protein